MARQHIFEMQDVERIQSKFSQWGKKISSSDLWGGAMKGLRAHPYAAGAGVASAFAYGIFREGQGPIESTAVMGPLAAGAFVAAAGGWPGVKGFASQVGDVYGFLSRTSDQWRGPGAAGISREAYAAAEAANPLVGHFGGLSMKGDNLARMRASVRTPEEIQTGITKMMGQIGEEELPMWARLAAVRAQAISEPGAARKSLFNIISEGGVGELAGGWTAGKITQAAEGSEAFAREFSSTAAKFRTAGIESIASVGEPTVQELTKRIVAGGPDDIIARLGGTRPELAEELGKIANMKGVRVAGMTYGIGGGEDIDVLRYIFSDARRAVDVPVVGPGGRVFGGDLGDNLYVARRQLFAGSLKSPEILDLDVAVARNIRQYHAAARGTGAENELITYLEDIGSMPSMRSPQGYLVEFVEDSRNPLEGPEILTSFF